MDRRKGKGGREEGRKGSAASAPLNENGGARKSGAKRDFGEKDLGG